MNYSKTDWWGRVQPPMITTSAGTKLKINWNHKIVNPAEILSEWLMADLCKRFTLAVAETGEFAIDLLAERLRVPVSALLSLVELMEFDLWGTVIVLPKEHPLAA